jgi:hypothetical protein
MVSPHPPKLRKSLQPMAVAIADHSVISSSVAGPTTITFYKPNPDGGDDPVFVPMPVFRVSSLTPMTQDKSSHTPSETERHTPDDADLNDLPHGLVDAMCIGPEGNGGSGSCPRCWGKVRLHHKAHPNFTAHCESHQKLPNGFGVECGLDRQMVWNGELVNVPCKATLTVETIDAHMWYHITERFFCRNCDASSNRKDNFIDRTHFAQCLRCRCGHHYTSLENWEDHRWFAIQQCGNMTIPKGRFRSGEPVKAQVERVVNGVAMTEIVLVAYMAPKGESDQR